MQLLPKSSQYGYIGLTVIVFLIFTSMIFFPRKFLTTGSLIADNGNNYCRPVLDAGAPVIVPANGKQYRLIKQNVPVVDHWINDPRYNHFGGYEEFQAGGKQYVIRDPAQGSGRSYQFASDVDPSKPFDIGFREHGIIFLFEVNEQKQPKTIQTPVVSNGGPVNLLVMDIYQEIGAQPLPEWVLRCQDLPANQTLKEAMAEGQGDNIVSQINPYVVVPDQDVSEKKDQLQLEWFLMDSKKFVMRNWWTPHCKPAVYLYPEKKQLVNVKVLPKGELGFTDPLYDPVTGWTVNADPMGRLTNLNNETIKNGYLYYESRIKDEEIKRSLPADAGKKPNKGWVVKFNDMEGLYKQILPKLGLNQKEAKDFSDYWLKTLPESPYYFVGLIEKEQRDYLEALQVTPKPDTSIRFSFFFEPLDEPISVEEPVIQTPLRNGFTLVDWGGMIKLHKDTLFTCSQ